MQRMMQTMSHESSGLCWCGPNNHGPEKQMTSMTYSTTTLVAAEHVAEYLADGWVESAPEFVAMAPAGVSVAELMQWYADGNEWAVSGDDTTFFARSCIAHGSRPLPLRA
jgi:hypothetical protein